MFDPLDRLGLDHGSAAKVFDERHPLAPGHRGDVFGQRRLHEAVHEEIAAMHFQHQRRLAGHRTGVVVERRLVRRAHLAQPRAARLEHIGNPESSADLQQFTPGYHDLVGGGPAEVVEDQHQRRGVVVDDGRGFRAAQHGEAVLEIRGAAPSCAAREVVFKVVVVRTDGRKRADDVGSERSPAEVGVHQNAGAVDHGADAGCAKVLQDGADAGERGIDVGTLPVRSQGVQLAAHHVDDNRARQPGVAERTARPCQPRESRGAGRRVMRNNWRRG